MSAVRTDSSRGLPAALRAALCRVLSALAARLPRSDAVVIVTRSDLHPANHGAAVKIDRTAHALARLVSAVYVVTAERGWYYRYRAGSRERLRLSWPLRKLAPRSRTVARRVRARGVPDPEAFLYYPCFDWSFSLRVIWLALRHGARRYQAEFPIYARACLAARELLGGAAAIVEHNVEFDRIARQYVLPGGVAAWMRDEELSLCRRVDLVVAVSARDRELLVGAGTPAGRVRIIPHGVDLEAFAAAAPLDLRDRLGVPRACRLLVYHGVYSYPPNLEAMRFLGREILPRLERRGVAVKVVAVGPFPPAESPHPDIVFVGPVPEVAPYVLGADVAVVPLLEGGGTRMKILDYFAAGVPVVSTSKGAEGLPIRDGVEALVRDDPEAFAAAVAELLAAPERARALGAAGRRFVAALDWSEIARRNLDALREREGAAAAPLSAGVEP